MTNQREDEEAAQRCQNLWDTDSDVEESQVGPFVLPVQRRSQQGKWNRVDTEVSNPKENHRDNRQGLGSNEGHAAQAEGTE